MTASVAHNPGRQPPESGRVAALAELRAKLKSGYRVASPSAFTSTDESIIATGFSELDLALGGGFPRGILATLEGPAGSGRSAIAARLLASATADGGLAAALESPRGDEGIFFPPALAAAGVDLHRLLVVPANDTKALARAADILLRSAAFGVVVIPALRLASTAWTRLVSLTHRAGVLLVALGTEASDELRYFASLRIRCSPASTRWAGASGPFCALAGTGVEATVLKHKRAAPGRSAHLEGVHFERDGPPLGIFRESAFTEISSWRSAHYS